MGEKHMRWYGQKRKERMEIRIEPALKEIIDDIAFEKNTNLSDFVRTLLIKEAKKYYKNVSTK
jgi:uncharacterized protein (DUF1778 family)